MLKKILESIHDCAVDAIITIDSRGIIQTINPAVTILFGYNASELIGQNVNLLMPTDFALNHNRYIADYLQSRKPKIIGIGREVIACRKDGSQFPIHLAISEIKLDEGIVFAGIIRDLSQYKMNEARMQHQLLINERLAAIGQTVSGLAHESRNAFQRSHACLEELALDLAEMPDSLKLVRKVQKALDDLHMMLEEVRSYAAPIILERRHCDLAAIIAEAWQCLVEVRGIQDAPEITVAKADDFPPHGWVDEDRIKQVFLNLLDNAWVACNDPKQIEVRLSTGFSHGAEQDSNFAFDETDPTTLPCRRMMRIEVCDSGSGIPSEDYEQVFEAFFTTKTRGTGLGLALCRRYVEAHEGRIFATNNARRGGACMVIELPQLKPPPRTPR